MKVRTILACLFPLATIASAADSPLIEAIKQGNKAGVEALLAKGAAVNGVDASSGEAPLHVAARYQAKDIAELLLSHGAKADVKTKNGLTPLMVAVYAPLPNIWRPNKELVELLLANGADINAVDDIGRTVLTYAVQNTFGSKDTPVLVAMLLAKGADIAVKIKPWRTVLDMAIDGPVREVLEAHVRERAAQGRQQAPASRAASAPSNAAGMEVITLSCSQTDNRPGTAPEVATLRIDYSTGLVESLAPSGKAYTNRIAPDARISDNAIVWSVKLMDTGLETPEPMTWSGTIDRLSGNAHIEWYRHSSRQSVIRTDFMCRAAPKAKF